ncbi:MAG: AAA family ATPase [Thermoplasmata archaeon]
MEKCETHISLTPSQEKVVATSVKLLSEYKILIIKGEANAGKYVVAREIFSRLNAIVEIFDLCELAKRSTRELSNQDVVEYLDYLLQKLNSRMNSVTDGLSENRSYRVNRMGPGVIYIRNYNMITDVLADCYTKLRFFLPLILKTFSEKIPMDVRIVITTTGICPLSEDLHWCIELQTTIEDMEHVLLPYLKRGIISSIEYQKILKITKLVPVGRILNCMKYAIAMCRDLSEEERDKYFFKTSIDSIESNIFVETYKNALIRLTGFSVNVEKDVPKPLEDELVGLDDIIDEITISIINPMKMNNPNIPIKKGLVLCGPPGTGKTSIGRWLAHQIKGKFYLIGGESSISGRCLVDAFQNAVKKANENAPAVVFIDDGDILFEQDEVYRAFLTILDGIENNKRNDVCVILTCMNLRKIPSSLLRGGRLEMVLITRLPDKNKISEILEKSLDKMQKVLNNYDISLSRITSAYLSKEFISEISLRMVGWNCADIHRCVNDVLRSIVFDKKADLAKLFDKYIKRIKEQYELCTQCESTNLDNRIHEVYII